ncbi:MULTISPECIES: glycine zipper 2TM domain-containing protein [Buttiauxella]|uniref:glycine zipper 2TM domain-containing protein n=1 Tax=Buttiauxella TaxID=82976 RepID=UPI00156091C9|nr:MULTISPECIES: glycine zipper 2TM domain-containing protein [Buttiauxella]MCS3601745.1 outer membrane lipoprotein SlyB [Buttiauxella sp. BIGb0471]BCG09331.1 glycine zipper 2TM domain-containing protein [Buttiauxella agrestis]
MKKYLLIFVSLLALSSQSSFAGTKTLVEYGVVQQAQIITSQTRSHPLRTVAAGAAGAAIGNQFGGGSGKTIMTATGAVAGAQVSRNRQSQQQNAQQVDLTIKTDAGQIIQVTQSYDGRITFNKGDKVRILTSGNNTSVDKSS